MDCVRWREEAEEKFAGELRAGRTGDEVILCNGGWIALGFAAEMPPSLPDGGVWVSIATAGHLEKNRKLARSATQLS
jgi:hypothetical protein